MKHQIYMMAKEVKETRDSKEAALLLQSGDWVAIGAAFQGEAVQWILIRVQDPGTGAQAQADTLALLRSTP